MVLGGGKDGVLYVLDRNNFGHSIGDLSKLRTPPSFFTWIPETNVASYAGATPTGDMDFKPMKGVKTCHLHGSPVYWNSGVPPAGLGPLLFVQGENEYLRVWSMGVSGATTLLAHGADRASAELADPANSSLGGMCGGMLTLSSNGSTNGIVWATVPLDGDANRKPVPGIVRVYDATSFDTVHKNPDGVPLLKLLWSAKGFT
jgi:hypothetical protein